jgi:hypothetical protein
VRVRLVDASDQSNRLSFESERATLFDSEPQGNRMASSNANTILEQLEDGRNYDLEFGETWNGANDGHSSRYAFHTVKCKNETIAVGLSASFASRLTVDL